MDKLPLNDIPMLVSAINFLLRDHEFETLDQICYHFNIDRKGLEAKMATQGFEWSEEQKKFCNLLIFSFYQFQTHTAVVNYFRFYLI